MKLTGINTDIMTSVIETMAPPNSLMASMEAARADLYPWSNFAWTPSINQGEKISEADRSVGKQLVYVPEYSSSVTGRLAYGPWRLVYRWCYYSERYTMSSNDNTITGYLTPYFMNDLSIERLIPLRWADTSVKLQINNLFNEEYRSVLAHPMPRMNFEVFLDIRPRWGKNRAER